MRAGIGSWSADDDCRRLRKAGARRPQRSWLPTTPMDGGFGEGRQWRRRPWRTAWLRSSFQSSKVPMNGSGKVAKCRLADGCLDFGWCAQNPKWMGGGGKSPGAIFRRVARATRRDQIAADEAHLFFQTSFCVEASQSAVRTSVATYGQATWTRKLARRLHHQVN